MRTDLVKSVNGIVTVEDAKRVLLSFVDRVNGLDGNMKRLVRDVKEDASLTLAEGDAIQKAVKAKGTELLGGKKSSAYHDASLRAKVFRDIHNEIKRQFGLYDAAGRPLRYVYLQRKNKDRALSMVAGYELPAALYEDVEAANTAD